MILRSLRVFFSSCPALGALLRPACGFLMALVCAVPEGGLAAETASQNIPSAEALLKPENAFVVFGKVTAGDSKPLSGVEVFAHCGNGTLFCTGTAVTDTKGEYQLAFGPGVLMGSSMRAGQLGVGYQAATISARKPGHFIKGLGRAGNLAMTDSTNTPPGWSTNHAGVVHAFRPYRLDFTLLPASAIRGRLLDPSRRLPAKFSLCLSGDKLPPSSSVLACVESPKDGNFHFEEVPVGYGWWLELSWREGDARKTLRSKPLSVAAPAPIVCKLTLTEDALLLEE
jgi:hypothetical protein